MDDPQQLDASPPPTEHHHRFNQVMFRGEAWDLSHLDSFSTKVTPLPDVEMTLVVIFSCHCFSHSLRWDERELAEIPADEIYDDGKERRVLDPLRYDMSRAHLKGIITGMPGQHIIVANAERCNFMTWEMLAADGTTQTYAVFFEVEKDRARKRRMILRVQSAYVLDQGLHKRQAQAKKVKWNTLLRAAYEGKKIKA